MSSEKNEYNDDDMAIRRSNSFTRASNETTTKTKTLGRSSASSSSSSSSSPTSCSFSSSSSSSSSSLLWKSAYSFRIPIFDSTLLEWQVIGLNAVPRTLFCRVVDVWKDVAIEGSAGADADATTTSSSNIVKKVTTGNHNSENHYQNSAALDADGVCECHTCTTGDCLDVWYIIMLEQCYQFLFSSPALPLHQNINENNHKKKKDLSHPSCHYDYTIQELISLGAVWIQDQSQQLLKRQDQPWLTSKTNNCDGNIKSSTKHTKEKKTKKKRNPQWQRVTRMKTTKKNHPDVMDVKEKDAYTDTDTCRGCVGVADDKFVNCFQRRSITNLVFRIHTEPSRFPMDTWKQNIMLQQQQHQQLNSKKGGNMNYHDDSDYNFVRYALVSKEVVLPAFQNNEDGGKSICHDYVVVNKPGGIPAHASVDNATENVLYATQQYYCNSINYKNGSSCYGNDNDNVDHSAQQYTHNQQPSCLFVPSTVPHRLDTDTCGLQIVSNAAFASYFGKLLEQKTAMHNITTTTHNDNDDNHHNKFHPFPPQQTLSPGVEKRYRCLVYWRSSSSSASSLDDDPSTTSMYQKLQQYCESKTILTHYAEKKSATTKLPRVFVSKPPPPSSTTEWQQCRLQLLSIAKSVTLSSSSSWMSLPTNSNSTVQPVVPPSIQNLQYERQNTTNTAMTATTTSVAELHVRLLTGRTHQIRGQLAAMGCPIVGDTLYYHIHHHHHHSAMTDNSNIIHNNIATKDETQQIRSRPSPRCRPYDALALQCCYMSFQQPYTVLSDGSNHRNCPNSKINTRTIELHEEEEEEGLPGVVDDAMAVQRKTKPKGTMRKKTRYNKHNTPDCLQHVISSSGITVEYSLETAWWSSWYHSQQQDAISLVPAVAEMPILSTGKN